jgi:hypothetical protein
LWQRIEEIERVGHTCEEEEAKSSEYIDEEVNFP